MNYIGSKLSLLDFLTNTITQVTGITHWNGCVFGDLFAGTGIVGATYRSMGAKVISNDIQAYSYVVNKHLIENPVNLKRDHLNYLNSLSGIEGFIYQNYCIGSNSGRMYFSDENGKRCDAIRTELNNLRTTKQITDQQFYCYLAGLLCSIDKVANTASVYGAFLKKLKKSAQKDLYLELLPFIKGPKGKVYKEDINDVVTHIKGDVLYLDPPYNSRQYCSNYHLLETIALYDNPEIRGMTGLRDNSTTTSKYCSKTSVCKTFDDLISKAKFKYIFLSYNNEGLMSLSEIQTIMSKYGKYDLAERKYHRFKADTNANRNIKADETTEYLHCLIKE